MLSVKNLSTYVQSSPGNWTPIVKDLNFNIDVSQVFALIGESGSGKTLTALSLMRLLPRRFAYAENSKILLQNTDLLNLQEIQMRSIRGARIAMIFQDPMTSLNPIYTVGVQIMEVLALHRKLAGQAAKHEVLRLLEAVRIADSMRCYNSYPHELSGGMQQRVMIAMALACKPTLLIADEPTTALDVTTQAKILQILQDLQQSEQLAMLLITHDLSIAARLANTMAVMQNGSIVEQNSTTAFFKNPQHAYSHKLLDNTPGRLRRITEQQATNPILEVENLQVHFPIKRGLFRHTVDYVRAVDDVTFNLHQGQTTALVGESGSGKSTVARAIMGLLNEAQGKIMYQETNLLALDNKQWMAFRHDIQIIFQNPYAALNSKLRILDSLAEGLRLRKMHEKLIQERIDELLIKVGLKPEYKWRYPHEFSGGERQRICIARALTVEPKIIICDEPTSSLDVSVQAQVLQLLLDLQSQQKLTYLFITHDLNIVRAIAQNVAVMWAGKIVEQGSVEEVFNHPQNAYTQSLLKAMPNFHV